MSYSLDFRRRVFAYKDKHQLTFQQTSEHFDVNIATLFRWQNKIEPVTGRNRPSIRVDMERLQKDVKQFPDAYQWERAKRLGVGQPAIHYALKRLNISVKKNADTSQSL